MNTTAHELSQTAHSALAASHAMFVFMQSQPMCRTPHQSQTLHFFQIFKDQSPSFDAKIETGKPHTGLQTDRPERLVEVNGIEPMTPCLQSRCSPS